MEQLKLLRSRRKQRKLRYTAPLHKKQKYLHVHLSSELRKKYGTRAILVKKGDKVKIMRGQNAKKEGKVDRINLTANRVYLENMEFTKKDGTKVTIPFAPSNLMIVSLDLTDKKRKTKLGGEEKQNEDNKAEDNKVNKEAGVTNEKSS